MQRPTLARPSPAIDVRANDALRERYDMAQFFGVSGFRLTQKASIPRVSARGALFIIRRDVISDGLVRSPSSHFGPTS
jgi:hypothetical protein